MAVQLSVYRCRRSTCGTTNFLLAALVTCWRRFHGKLITVIPFEPRIFSSIPTLICSLHRVLSFWYLRLTFKAFVALLQITMQLPNT